MNAIRFVMNILQPGTFWIDDIKIEYGQKKEALEDIDKQIKVQSDDALNFILKVQVLQAMEQYNEASQEFDKATSLDPGRWDVWGMKAASLAKIGKFDEAIISINKGIELAPNQPVNVYNRAFIYCLNGQTTTYAYDAVNRIVSARYADLSAVNYFYDQGPNGLGRLASIIETDPAGQPIRRTDYAHDAHGRVVAETRAIGGVAYTTAYGYDDAGRLVSLIYPSGRSVRYALNALGRIAEVSTTQDGATRVLASAIRYRPFGGLESLRFGNGQPYARSFDGDGRITGHTLGSRSQALHLDAASRITRIADPANPLQENSYSYDVLDRLTGYSRPGVSQGFSYDALGDRLNRSLGAALDTYAYDAGSNRLASITSETGALRSFQHDANRSITGHGVNLFAYDARGRMVSAATTAGTVHYELNALGQRVAKHAPGGTTLYHYDISTHVGRVPFSPILSWCIRTLLPCSPLNVWPSWLLSSVSRSPIEGVSRHRTAGRSRRSWSTW